MTDAGMPRRGFISLRYYCGDGERINGCRAEVTARKALLCLVKIDEADLLADENNTLEDGTKIHNLLVGANYAKQYKPSAGSTLPHLLSSSHSSGMPAIWDQYLAPFNSPSARMARGEKFVEVFGDHYDAVEKIFTKLDAATTQQDSGALKSVYKPATVATGSGAVAGAGKETAVGKASKGRAKSAVASGKRGGKQGKGGKKKREKGV
jgi:hypothetical protein